MACLRCVTLSLLLVSLVSGAWNPFPNVPQGFSAHARPNVGETGGALARTTAGLAVPPVRGGGFLWWKSTDEKAEAAKEHAKKSWFWGKEYAKDKATDTKDAAAAKAEQAKRKAAQASAQSKESLYKVKDKLGEKYDTVKEHAKCVASETKEGVKEGVDSTKATLATGKHKIEAVGNTVEVLGDVKTGYDKYLHGKARAKQVVRSAEDGVEEGVEKTKGILRRIVDFLLWPVRPRTTVMTTTTSRRRGATTMEEDAPFVLEEENVVTAPRSVDDALEEFEACKVRLEVRGGREGGRE